VILFAHSLLSPLDGDAVVASESLHPVPVIVGAPAEHFFVRYWYAENLVEKVDHLFGPGQTAEVAVDDDAVEQWYIFPIFPDCCRHRSSVRPAGGIKFVFAERKGKKGFPKGKKP
jgi:hypothetical protein